MKERVFRGQNPNLVVAYQAGDALQTLSPVDASGGLPGGCALGTLPLEEGNIVTKGGRCQSACLTAQSEQILLKFLIKRVEVNY